MTRTRQKSPSVQPTEGLRIRRSGAVLPLLALGLSLVLPGVAAAHPSGARLEQGYKKAYTARRFVAADMDRDGQLSRHEAAAAYTRVERGTFIGPRFRDADHDRDGRLSLSEARGQRKAERHTYRRDKDTILVGMYHNPYWIQRRAGACHRR